MVWVAKNINGRIVKIGESIVEGGHEVGVKIDPILVDGVTYVEWDGHFRKCRRCGLEIGIAKTPRGTVAFNFDSLRTSHEKTCPWVRNQRNQDGEF